MKTKEKYEEVKVVLEEFQTFTWSVTWIDLRDKKHSYEFTNSLQAKDLYDQLNEDDDWKYRALLRIKRK